MILDITTTDFIVFVVVLSVGVGVGSSIFQKLIKPRLDRISKRRKSNDI